MRKTTSWDLSLATRLKVGAGIFLAASLALAAVTLRALSDLDGNVGAINLLGLRRVLSYKALLLAASVHETIGAERARTLAALRATLAQMDATCAALRLGDPTQGLPRPIDPEVLPAVLASEEEWHTQIRPAIEANAAATRLFGYPPEEVLGRDVRMLMPPAWRDRHQAAVERLLRTGAPRMLCVDREVEGLRKDGTVFPLALRVTEMQHAGNDAFVGILQDVSARKQEAERAAALESQLHQAQKMQSLGLLAGGIAHDFNNLLTSITGLADLTAQRLPPESPLVNYARMIQQAGESAATLTHQLLAFSRKQILQPEVLEVDAVVGGLHDILRRTIGENIEMVVVRPSSPCRARADRGQIEQVIMNLVVNARDAMLRGGRLTLATAAVDLDAAGAAVLGDVAPGRHVVLSVSDTGCGMTPEVKAHLFEPFFTTKGVGRGTGLGLATVYGIVKQSGGAIAAESEPGRGTTFKVYLPRVSTPTAHRRPELPANRPGGSETGLVVDDAGAVRFFASEVLKLAGYRVLAATGPEQALSCAQSHDGPIDLLLTDILMPGMTGGKLAAQLVVLRPQLRVLFMSGYTETDIVERGELAEGVAFLPKPLSVADLTRMVRAVLDAPPGAAAAAGKEEARPDGDAGPGGSPGG